MYEDKMAEIRSEIKGNEFQIACRESNIAEAESADVKIPNDDSLADILEKEHIVTIKHACWSQGAMCSYNQVSKYGVKYYDLAGLPVDKEGKEVGAGSLKDIAGYILGVADLEYNFDLKRRDMEPIEQDGKPIILSVNEFEGLIKEAAAKGLEDAKEALKKDKEYAKVLEKQSEIVKKQRELIRKVVVAPHVGKPGKMSKLEKIYRLRKVNLKE